MTVPDLTGIDEELRAMLITLVGPRAHIQQTVTVHGPYAAGALLPSGEAMWVWGHGDTPEAAVQEVAMKGVLGEPGLRFLVSVPDPDYFRTTA